MNINRNLSLGLLIAGVACCNATFGLNEAAAQTYTYFNFAGNTNGGNMVTYPLDEPGTIFNGATLNDHDGTGIAAGTVVDRNGSSVPGISLSAFSEGAAGGVQGNDTAPELDAVAGTYGDGVGRSLFWSNDSLTVTVSGLSANSDYRLGLVAAADGRGRTLDVSLNGNLVAEGLDEQEMVGSLNFYTGTADGSGDIEIVLDNLSDAIGWQALVLTDDLAADSGPAVELRVGTNSGDVTLHSNSSFFALNAVKGYSIRSESDSLNADNWNSFQEQGVADGGAGAGNTNPTDGIGWEQLGDGTNGLLGESNLLSSTEFGLEQDLSVSLGNLFTGGNDESLQDLEVEVQLVGGSVATIPVVYIEDTGPNGDFDGDNDVDGSDFLLWQRGGTSPPLSPDALSDWQSSYGGGAVAAATAVPEPTALHLFLLSVLAPQLCRKSRQRAFLLCRNR